MNTYVTKPYLPPKDEYLKRVEAIFDRDILTNQGPEVQELEASLGKFLGVTHVQYVTNGTIALQLALHCLDIFDGEIITTPFSYVATLSSILWERCTPIFVDVEEKNFTIDTQKIEKAITPRTKAIMPVHIFGYACDVEAIEKIAREHDLKVIYDAAHSFGSRYKGKALCSYGDISTLSFHATKLFHTIEGGACIIKDKAVSNKLDYVKRFGHEGNTHFMLGINAKQDEFNAAMGNTILPHLDDIINERKRLSKIYDTLLPKTIDRPIMQKDLEYNYAYYPVLFESEQALLAAFERLQKHRVFPRRYFYPSLNTLPYLKEHQECPISENICSRIACLPLFVGLEDSLIEKICEEL